MQGIKSASSTRSSGRIARAKLWKASELTGRALLLLRMHVGSLAGFERKPQRWMDHQFSIICVRLFCGGAVGSRERAGCFACLSILILHYFSRAWSCFTKNTKNSGDIFYTNTTTAAGSSSTNRRVYILGLALLNCREHAQNFTDRSLASISATHAGGRLSMHSKCSQGWPCARERAHPSVGRIERQSKKCPRAKRKLRESRVFCMGGKDLCSQVQYCRCTTAIATE